MRRESGGVVQLQMRGWQGRRGELTTDDGRPVGTIELGGRRGPDRVDLGATSYEVSRGADRRTWVVRTAGHAVEGTPGERPSAGTELRRTSRVTLRYELTLDDGRVLEVAPAARVRRHLAVTDAGTREEVGRLERGGTFRTVWTLDVGRLPGAAQAACVWVAVATDREDEASNVAAVT